MLVKKLNTDVTLPTRESPYAAAFDIYMPTHGTLSHNPCFVPLGFAVAIPEGYVGLLVPRSSTGSRFGLCITNTIGVIDSDYRGELVASLSIKPNYPIRNYSKDDRLIQLVVVPIYTGLVEEVDKLPETARGHGGFGSTGI